MQDITVPLLPSVGDGFPSSTAQLSGNQYLREALRSMGITLYAGVNGGGVIHFAKLLDEVRALGEPAPGSPRMFTVPEYAAGFVPLGHFLATGRPAACLATTGAATRLVINGLLDAKAHNIPAVYVVALNSTTSYGKAPLQDVSDRGANLVPQLQNELADGFFHVTDLNQLPRQIGKIRTCLRQSRPVVVALHPDVQLGPVPLVEVDPPESDLVSTRVDRGLLAHFRKVTSGRRVVVLVTEEAGRSGEMPALTTRLAEALGSPVLWTVNGAAGVEAGNRFGYGHIGFGGNDAAAELWGGIGPDDVLLTLGFEPGEYVLNLASIRAGSVIHLTGLAEPYGHIDGTFAHRCAGEYTRFACHLPAAVNLLARAAGTLRQPCAPDNLNAHAFPRVSRPDVVDFAEFLGRVHRSWRRPGLVFDDVCMAYKDRQYVTQRPHPLMRAYAAYQGSAMGGAFGMAIGAKLGAPDRLVSCFSGDGCFRLYAGALPESADLGLNLFVIDNESYAIVEQGLRRILYADGNFHARIASVDHVSAARAFGWDAVRLDSDLANLDEIMDRVDSRHARSLLVEVPVDPGQDIGPNPRLQNLGADSHL